MQSRQARSDPLHCTSTQIRHRLWFCCDTFFTCIFLCSFRHRFKTIHGTEMANVEQTQKMVPLIACEISLCQYVCELVFGVNVFDLDFGVQIDSIKRPIKSNSVGFWKHVSLLGFFPLSSFWSLLRCLQRWTKIASWREEFAFEETNQHYSDHQSSEEFSFVLEM